MLLGLQLGSYIVSRDGCKSSFARSETSGGCGGCGWISKPGLEPIRWNFTTLTFLETKQKQASSLCFKNSFKNTILQHIVMTRHSNGDDDMRVPSSARYQEHSTAWPRLIVLMVKLISFHLDPGLPRLTNDRTLTEKLSWKLKHIGTRTLNFLLFFWVCLSLRGFCYCFINSSYS